MRQPDYEYNPSGVLVPKSSTRPILGEVASSLDGRDITRLYLDPLRVAPPDDPVLMQRGGGDYTLYREILRDERVKSGLDQRIRAVVARPWEVKPGGDSRRDNLAAKDLEAQLNAVGWDAITEKMLYGVFYGYAVGEAMWGRDGSRVTLSALKVRDRRRFGFDGVGRLRLRTMHAPDGELLPERKFWHFATGADHDDAPYGLGLAHWLYWPVWIKRNGIRFWATFLEKFGTPTAVGRFPAGTSVADQGKLLAALRAIQRDSAIIFPDGMQAELLEATRSGSADHEAFAKLMNDAITILITGQTASTQGQPGKLGASDEQNAVRMDITRADADLVCQSFNLSVARWLTEWNWPGAAIPSVWRIMDDNEDLNSIAERDHKLAQVGYKPTLARVTEVYGEGYEAAALPASGKREEGRGKGVSTLLPSPFSLLSGEGSAAVAFAEAAAESDPESAQIDRLARDTAPILADLFAGVGKVIDNAPSLAALQTDLVEAYGHLDTEDLTRVMTLAFAAAELAGMAEGKGEGKW